jgi:glycine oxidase
MHARDADVIVIGAGVVGCATAFELASRGRRVAVVDMRAPGAGASRASAGILAPYVEGHHSPALRQVGLRSLALYPGFVARIVAASGLAVEFSTAGTLEVAMDDEDVARLQHSAATLGADGVPNTWMDGARARTLEPTLHAGVRGALHIPVHATVHVPAFTAACAAGARAAGAAFHDGLAVSGVSPAGDGVVVHTTQGELRAPEVVLAAGSWSGALAPPGAARPPIRPVRGQLVHLQAGPGAVAHVLWGRDVYLVPWHDGAVFVGATSEDVGFDERTTATGVQGLLARALALAPGLADAAFVEARAGLRPGTDDSLPFIGRSDVLPGLVYACGHFRNGALLAPLTARLVANVLEGDAGDPALPLVAPSRAGRL